MLRLRKNYFIFGLGFIFSACFLPFFSSPAHALVSSIKQVKVKDSPAVYFLYHAGHRKKAYLNAGTYLDYGNSWSQIKTISSAELNSWPDARLIKKTGTAGIYYIKGNKKALIANMADLRDFSLTGEPVLSVSQTDLNQYLDSDYDGLGLVRGGNNSGNQSSASQIQITQDLITGNNNNTILTNTNGNLVGIFHFDSAQAVKISSIAFKFGGVHNNALVKAASIFDENDNQYDASVNVRNSENELLINFRSLLAISPGAGKTLKIYLDLDTCENCNNQTLRLELRAAGDIISSSSPQAIFPLRGTEFKFLDGSNLIGQVKAQEQSIAGDLQSVPSGGRLIGKFVLSEESGREEVLVKKVKFLNNGTAGYNDWQSFQLFNNDQIISRATALNIDHEIEFDINYLRLAKDTPVNLSVIAMLKSDYNPQATVNLRLSDVVAIGKTYNNSLSPQIVNLEESFSLR